METLTNEQQSLVEQIVSWYHKSSRQVYEYSGGA